jgi:thiamine biosynthesis lipoprotein
MSRYRRALLALLIAIAIGAVVIWRSGGASSHAISPSRAGSESTSFAGNTMGGTWSVKLAQLPPGSSQESLQACVGELLDRLDSQMSIWKPESNLSAFNRYRGDDWFPVPRELADVVAEAQRVSEQTVGAFDVTVGPLVLLWGFGPARSGGQTHSIPSDEAISTARSHVGYRLLECRLLPPALRKHDPELYVDLGGIAKGYAADAVGAFLNSVGIHRYLIAVGGELRAHGMNEQERPWSVGIETPTPDVRRIFCQLDLRDQSLSTSGDYRNFFEVGGRRYCHEIDPRTGAPIEPGLASVSVIHASGTYADAMATALMVLGPKEGYDRACRLKLAVLFIVRSSDHFETLRTPEFEKVKTDARYERKERLP